jgi:NAD(P)H-flavin reductase
MSQQKNPYQPQKGIIEKVITETPGIKTFVVRPENGFEFHCGQFAELTIPGVGEAPFAMSSPASKPDILEFTVQIVG